MLTVLNRMENHDWLYLQFMVTHLVCHRRERKKSCSKLAKFTERCELLWQWFFSSGIFFCETFSFWDMIDFDVCDFMYVKSTIFQKLKVAQ